MLKSWLFLTRESRYITLFLFGIMTKRIQWYLLMYVAIVIKPKFVLRIKYK